MNVTGELAALNRLYENPRLYVEALSIRDKKKRVHRFGDVMTGEQRQILNLLDKKDEWGKPEVTRLALVKARQIGATTTVLLDRFARLSVSREPLLHMIASVKEPQADKLLAMLEVAHNQLPERYRRPSSRKECKWRWSPAPGAAQGPMILAQGARAVDSDRGNTYTSAHLTEFAFMPNGMDVLASASAAVGEGLLVIESTPSHYGDPLHQVAMSAEYPEEDGSSNGWEVLFFPWWSFPGYVKRVKGRVNWTFEERLLMRDKGLRQEQVMWRRSKIAELRGVRRFRREFPEELDDAWSLSDEAYYGDGELDVYHNILPTSGGLSDQWEEPRFTRNRYVVGVDVAEGVGGDYTVAIVMDAWTLRPVPKWASNRTGISHAAEAGVRLATKWGRALMHIEKNNHGHAYIQAVDALGYSNYMPHLTTEASKIQLYDVQRTAIVEKLVDTVDKTTLSELRRLLRSERGLAPSVPNRGGHHDDHSIAYGLALSAAHTLPRPSRGL